MKRIGILLLALALSVGCGAAGEGRADGPKDRTELPLGTEATPAPLKQPPALTVIVGAQEGSAVLSTYSWDWPGENGTRTGVEADGPHPLEMLPDLTPIPSDGAEQLTLRFDRRGLALDKLTIRRWDFSCAGDRARYEAGFEMLPFTVAGDAIAVDLPDDRGGIFEVHAYFQGESHGDGYYAFCLRNGSEDDPKSVVAFSWEKARIVWREELRDVPPVRIIRTKPAFEDALATERALGGALPDRDEDFFAHHELVLLHFEEPSGSISHEVTAVLPGADGLTVIVHRVVPEVGTSDMGAWLLFVDLPAGTVPEDASVVVRIL